jgi:DNA gyrase/topoisomerase IV subunit A
MEDKTDLLNNSYTFDINKGRLLIYPAPIAPHYSGMTFQYQNRGQKSQANIVAYKHSPFASTDEEKQFDYEEYLRNTIGGLDGIINGINNEQKAVHKELERTKKAQNSKLRKLLLSAQNSLSDKHTEFEEIALLTDLTHDNWALALPELKIRTEGKEVNLTEIYRNTLKSLAHAAQNTSSTYRDLKLYESRKGLTFNLF